MADVVPGVRRGGAGRDGALARQAAAAVIGAVALAAAFLGAAQVPVQRAAHALIRPEVAVDRLVADSELALQSESASYLLWAPVLAQQRSDPGPVHWREPLVASRSRAPPPRIPVSELGAVGGVAVGTIPPDLAQHGAAMPPQDPGDRGRGQAALPQEAERVSFGKGDLSIHGGLHSLGGELKSTGFAGHLFSWMPCCTYYMNSRCLTSAWSCRRRVSKEALCCPPAILRCRLSARCASE